jgi:hypothetical protein
MAHFFDEYERLARNLEQSRLLTESAEKALKSSLSMYQQVLEVEERMNRLVRPHHRVLEDLNKQYTIWQGLVLQNLDTVNQPNLGELRIQAASLVWNDSLSQTITRLEELSLLTRKEHLSLRLLEPSRMYTEFVQRTTWLLEQNENERVTKALRASLYLVERQWQALTPIISSIIAPLIDNEPVSPVRGLTLPIVQQNEILTSPEAEAEEDETVLLQISPAARTAQTARDVLSLVIQCNEAAKIAGKEEIFKPTTRLLAASVDLFWIVPDEKQSFAEFVDCLYFIFYEGAGKDHLRFLADHGGVLSDSDSAFIWCIKHLRNKWLHHDADHGKESAIRKSWDELSAKFSWLGLGHVPITPEHFRHLHNCLLKEAEAFLRKILAKMMDGK